MLSLIPTFEQFLEKYPRYKNIADNPSGRRIYAFLSQPETILNMITANNMGKPALAGCIEVLERDYACLPSFDFTISGTVKQAIGAMVATIIEPFGYFPTGRQKRMGASMYFSTAQFYYYDASRAYLEAVNVVTIRRRVSE
ncbi:MAG: hypothetical protein ACM3UW_01570 [Bacillota bacterium]